MRLSTLAVAFVFALELGASGTSAAQAAPPPSTDIFLAPVHFEKGQPVIGAPVNITNRPGYDNQPSFTPDSRAILFTSVRADAQADIYRYDVGTKAITRLTSTPESEYSATVYDNGRRFSVIRVEHDSTQRLWSFRLDGTDPRLVFTDIKPVGYHTWVDTTTVAMFLLGTPNALVLADTRSGRADTVARNVGRSLVTLPDSHGFSFLRRGQDSSWTLTAVDVRGPNQTMLFPLVRMPSGADYVAWLEPLTAISAAGTKLMIWRGKDRTQRWTELADLARYGLKRVSRLALSPDRRWLAIVAEER